MKVELDVGQNITSLLERLAAQVGTTADKVFPWYVQQAHNEGVTSLIAISVILLLLLTVFLVSLIVMLRKSDIAEPVIAICGISGIALLIVGAIGIAEGVEAARKIMNPNYYAMTMMTRDIGRLAGK